MNADPNNSNEPTRDADLFDEMLEQIDLATASGMSARFDDTLLSDTLRDELAGLGDCVQLLNAAAHQGGLAALDNVQISGADGACATNGAGDAALHAGESDGCLAGERIGRFEIVRELGRGGYGVVFLARDLELSREVALKLPRPEALVTPELRRRFLREARAAGRLDHPHVLGVYEVGEDGGLCYLVSPFCRGPSLARWLAEQSEPLPARDAAQLVARLAEGLEHAHRLGVLHRDIKPSNVLLDLSATERHAPAEAARRSLGSYVPKLTDFGLAKLLEAADQDTRTGALLGTPAYMAPEQADGRLAEIGTATDVYALGAVLYELLTGRPPLVGESDAETLALVRGGDPLAPRQLKRTVPRDLEAVALKCLEKNPADRYGSAGKLAQDLQRFLNGQPTQARPASPLRRLVKWTRRRPAVAISGIATPCLLLLMVIGGLSYSARFGREHAHVVRNQYARDMQSAFRARQNGGVDQVASLLGKYDANSADAALRNFEWYWLRQALEEQRVVVQSKHLEAYAVLFTADGRYLFSGGKDGVIRAWNTRDGSVAFELRGHTDCVNQLALSPDGESIASASCDKTVRIWNLATKKLEKAFEHPADVGSLAFAPHAPLLVAGMHNSKLIVWNIDSARQETSLLLAAPNEAVDAVAFSPDGRLLAGTTGSANCVLWDTTSWQRAHDRTLSALSLSFTPDSERLVLGLHSRDVVEWDFGHSDAVRHLGTLPGEVRTLAALNHPGTVLAAGIDGSVHAIGLDGPRQRIFSGGMARLSSLAVSRDGEFLAAASFDGSLRIWEFSKLDGAGAALPQPARVGLVLPRAGELMEWSTDGSLTHTRMSRVLSRVGGSGQLLSASPGGNFLWTGDNRNRIYTLRPLADLQPVSAVDRLADVASASVSADERTFASVDSQRLVRILDLVTGKETARFFIPTATPVDHFAIGLNSDGSRLVVFESSRFAGYSFDTRDGSKAPLPEDLSFAAAAFMHPGHVIFSPDGRRSVRPTDDRGTFVLAESMQGDVITELRHRDTLTSTAAWSPDGTRLLMLTRAQSLAIFDPETGELLGEMDGGLEPVVSNLRFSDDGQTLQAFCGAVEGSPGHWRYWRAPRGEAAK